jgi:renalase
MSDVVVVGAGLTGLTAALVIAEAGRSVSVIDKGRGVGGRLATRRIDDATFDHGAQFFTVRGDTFRVVVNDAVDEGVVDTWCHGFGEQDGYPRFFCPAGMNSLAKWLAARVRQAGGTIVTGHQVSSIHGGPLVWSVVGPNGEAIEAADVALTAPVPQSLELVRSGGVELGSAIEASLSAISYKPTLALLVSLDGPSGLADSGGIQQDESDLFTFIADNRLKGVSSATAVTFHVNGDTTADRWDDDTGSVIEDLLEHARPWLGSSGIRQVQLKKWKYAGPRVPHPDSFVVAATSPGRLIFAGDAFAGPKVEGAFNSGRAAGLALVD